MKNENIMHVKEIAANLEKLYNNQLWKCPECGELVEIDENEKITCGCEVDVDDLENVSVLEYFEDNIYDIEYRIGSDRKFRSVKIMVACGGPNIYIDTADCKVKLYWWTDYAEAEFYREIGEMINEEFEMLFNC